MPLHGKVAVVTGGGKGIGRATASRLARDGASVAVWGRSRGPIDETVAAIETEGGIALACVADTTVQAEIDAAVALTRDAFGPIGILINNAGLAEFGAFLDLREDDVERVLRANVIGPFLCSQAVVPDMLAAGWGRIVNITSSAAQDGLGLHSHYAASKAGLVGLTKGLAMEFAATGITVNHIPVFFVETPGLHAAPLGSLESFVPVTPMKRMGRAEEVAATCAFLASDDAGYINGQPISLNGGRYLP
jgi:2-hydroxycyclohexanecarboxyl-CoA dehydrogenase